MTESDSETQPPAADRSEVRDANNGLGAKLRTMPRWEKIALGLALTAVVAGGVLTLMSGDAPVAPGTDGTGAGGTGLRTSLIDGPSSGTGGTNGGSSAATEEPAAKGFFRLGFSFLAGFSIGTFLRATLKIAAIAFGFWLVMTSALAYIDIVNVDWQAMQGLWDRFRDNVGSEWGNFQTFMLGSLPATGLAAGGLYLGLRRRR